MFNSDGRTMIWRTANSEYKLKNLKGTVKHGGDSVMIWGYMAVNGVGDLVFIDGIMNKMSYLNILKNHLKSSSLSDKLQLENNYYVQHDNDPKHTAYIVKQWVLYNTLHVLATPPQSPDVNPIEHLWAEIEKKLRHFEITNIKILKEKILQV